MSVLLPQPRLPMKAVPRLIDYGADQQSPLGGVSQRLNRLGNRFALEITYPRLRPDPDGRILASALRQAKTEGARFPFPQPGLDIGEPGAPRVNGGGQIGSVIYAHGFVAGYPVRAGQFFSIVHGGRRYLHQVTVDVMADANGMVAMTILPMLRIEAAHDDQLEFDQPFIEGAVSGTIDVEHTIAKAQLPAITITERR